MLRTHVRLAFPLKRRTALSCRLCSGDRLTLPYRAMSHGTKGATTEFETEVAPHLSIDSDELRPHAGDRLNVRPPFGGHRATLIAAVGAERGNGERHAHQRERGRAGG